MKLRLQQMKPQMLVANVENTINEMRSQQNESRSQQIKSQVLVANVENTEK